MLPIERATVSKEADYPSASVAYQLMSNDHKALLKARQASRHGMACSCIRSVATELQNLAYSID